MKTGEEAMRIFIYMPPRDFNTRPRLQRDKNPSMASTRKRMLDRMRKNDLDSYDAGIAARRGSPPQEPKKTVESLIRALREACGECTLSKGMKSLPKAVLQSIQKRATRSGDTEKAEAVQELINNLGEALTEGYDQDPDRDRMLQFLQSTFGNEFNEFDAEEAIYFFAELNHGGQNSNLYSVLSTSQYSPGPIRTVDSMLREDGLSAMMYEALEHEFGSGPAYGDGPDGERSQQHLGDFV